MSNQQRNTEIFLKYLDGRSASDIAKDYNVSCARVCTLVKNTYKDVVYSIPGMNKKYDIRIEEIRKNKDTVFASIVDVSAKPWPDRPIELLPLTTSTKMRLIDLGVEKETEIEGMSELDFMKLHLPSKAIREILRFKKLEAANSQ